MNTTDMSQKAFEKYLEDGLTLWDYYAAAALEGLIASNDPEAGDRIEEVPQYAGWIADAMLAERTKRFGGES